MGRVFCIDIARCSGCYNCQFACKDEHCGNEWLPYAKEQPLTGQFWTKIEEHVRGSKPNVRIYYKPLMCGHCADAPCLKAAKDGAVYRREDGLVLIDPEKSAGQRQIMEACPYGMIYWNDALDLPQKCTGCAHLLEDGLKPRCVDVCRTGALQFGDEEEFADFISEATVLNPEFGTGPRVYYKNIPGQFIAGTVYDPEEEVVIRNARCILSCGEKTWEIITDTFGDFWFRELPVGIFDLKIEAEGFETIERPGIDTAECVSLGDIPMKRLQTQQK